MADAEAPTVTFPDDYPNSVRHFLLIGFLGMFIGSIVFFYMGISRKVNTVSHVLTFFIAAVLAMKNSRAVVLGGALGALALMTVDCVYILWSGIVVQFMPNFGGWKCFKGNTEIYWDDFLNWRW